jgi:hypothetical protein
VTTLEYGGIVFDEESVNGFHLGRLVGWDDGAPTKYDAPDRPQGHGTFRPGKVFRGARVVSVEGSWSGATIEDAYRARRQLAGVSADESPFVVRDPLGMLQVDAALAQAPQADDRLYSPFFKFSFDVVTSDSFRYGDWVPAQTGVPTASSGLTWPLGSASSGLFWDWGTEGVSGRVAVSNGGTADTYSTFEVTGGLSGGFLLTWVPTGAEIRFTRPIPDGSTIYLNPRTGRASIDGQSDVTGYLIVSEWWPILPGQSGEVQFTPLGAVTGTPRLTVKTADAYV